MDAGPGENATVQSPANQRMIDWWTFLHLFTLLGLPCHGRKHEKQNANSCMTIEVEGLPPRANWYTGCFPKRQQKFKK